MKTFKNFTKVIKKSPLGFIKGDCHLVNWGPDDFPLKGEKMDNDDFNNPPIITFSYKDKFIGKIILKKDMDLDFDFSEEKGPNLTLDIRENGMWLMIYIKCPGGGKFPFLEEFGEFLATAEKKREKR